MSDIYLFITMTLALFVSMVVGYMLGLNLGYKIVCEINEFANAAAYNAGYIDGMNGMAQSN